MYLGDRQSYTSGREGQSMKPYVRGYWVTLLQTRPNLKRNVRAQFDFVAAYDLLHFTVYNSGSVGFAVNVLSEWLTLYEKDQFRQYQRQFLHRAGQVQNAQSLSPPNSILSSDELPPECHLDWLQQSLPFLVSLQQRPSDNQIRLKNEIDLNYSLVQQADAKAMRRISVVTMLFLPATFVSTFLSMSFFNHGADSPGDRFEWKIAPQLWIYAAIAAPLTLAAIFAWFGGYILIWLKEALLKPMNRLFWLIASEQRSV